MTEQDCIGAHLMRIYLCKVSLRAVSVQNKHAGFEFMSNTLTLLHTSPIHIATFDRLLMALAPDVPVRHIVREALLSDARANGLSPGLMARIGDEVRAAASGTSVVLCTCSTIGACAEQAGACADGVPVLRVDRPMAARAVSLGGTVVIAAALASALAPARALVMGEAGRAGKPIAIVEVLCDGAWALFEAGDDAGYIAALLPHVRRAATLGDVVVLAQASMSAAVDVLGATAVPVLSSPRLGLEAAVATYRVCETSGVNSNSSS